MIKLGNTARHLRDVLGLKQREVAEALGISIVHLCNVENNKSSPSPALLARYKKLWGVDLYMLAWCLSGDLKKLPPAIRAPAEKLAEAWREQIRVILNRRREDDSPCSSFVR
jgi:transcriptional regulator with XRE-family HTH domain